MERVAAAIHVHGMGLADNAVNVTYQFLARKVTMLSQVTITLPIGAALLMEVVLSCRGTPPIYSSAKHCCTIRRASFGCLSHVHCALLPSRPF